MDITIMTQLSSTSFKLPWMSNRHQQVVIDIIDVKQFVITDLSWILNNASWLSKNVSSVSKNWSWISKNVYRYQEMNFIHIIRTTEVVSGRLWGSWRVRDKSCAGLRISQSNTNDLQIWWVLSSKTQRVALHNRNEHETTGKWAWKNPWDFGGKALVHHSLEPHQWSPHHVEWGSLQWKGKHTLMTQSYPVQFLTMAHAESIWFYGIMMEKPTNHNQSFLESMGGLRITVFHRKIWFDPEIITVSGKRSLHQILGKTSHHKRFQRVQRYSPRCIYNHMHSIQTYMYIWGLSKIPFPGQPSIAQPIA